MQVDLNVSNAPTAALVPYAGNAKEHPEWQVEQIAASIEQFGFNDPVGVWHDGDGNPVIVEGHGRVLAAKMLGIEEVPVVALDHLDDEGRRAYTLAHNKLTTNTGYDMDMLAAELGTIEDIDMEAFGFDGVVSVDDFGTEFTLADGDGPIFHTVTLTLDDSQYADVQRAIDEVDADGGGNDAGNSIAWVVKQWRAAQTSK